MKRVLLLLVCALSVGLFHSCSEDLGELKFLSSISKI